MSDDFDDNGGGTLEQMGFERFADDFAPYAASGLEPGRVVRTIRGHLWVATAAGVARVQPSGNMAAEVVCPEAMPVVGDWVALLPGEETTAPVVEAVLPRRSTFVRKDPGKAAVGQVMAANIDTVFIVHGMDTEPNLRRLERELALAWESGATPVIVLSKSDLAKDPDAYRAAIASVALDVDVHVESAETGEGLDALMSYAEGHRTIALIGPSGVGKSTIVNRLLGGDVQAVGAVRASDGKGRHTTVTRQLVPLANGGMLIDTPGLRAVAMWDARSGLESAFPDVSGLAEQCRFDDCTHVHEPGCAVLAAVADGSLSQERYDSYMKLREELAQSTAKREVRQRAETSMKAKASKRQARGRSRDDSR